METNELEMDWNFTRSVKDGDNNFVEITANKVVKGRTKHIYLCVYGKEADKLRSVLSNNLKGGIYD